MLKELAIHALYECVMHDGVCPFVELPVVVETAIGIAERVWWMSSAASHQLCSCSTLGCMVAPKFALQCQWQFFFLCLWRVCLVSNITFESGVLF